MPTFASECCVAASQSQSRHVFYQAGWKLGLVEWWEITVEQEERIRFIQEKQLVEFQFPQPFLGWLEAAALGLMAIARSSKLVLLLRPQCRGQV